LRHSFIKIKATVAFPRDPIYEIGAVFGGVLALKICPVLLWATKQHALAGFVPFRTILAPSAYPKEAKKRYRLPIAPQIDHLTTDQVPW
jgi:hypothetical protein